MSYLWNVLSKESMECLIYGIYGMSYLWNVLSMESME